MTKNRFTTVYYNVVKEGTMIISYKMFLLVAEELNISRAAKRAFVTQQCASDHIKRLEEQYGVKLFERKPKLALTAAGVVMQEKLRYMETIESVMLEEIQEIKGENVGNLRVGINPTRARILLPDALKSYKKNFKKINTSVYLHDTAVLEEMLLKNEIDMFLGVNTSSNSFFTKAKVADDSIFLLGTSSFFFNEMKISKKILEKIIESGINLDSVRGLPIVRNLTDSTLNHVINRHLGKSDVVLDTFASISDYDTQISICGKGLGIVFCPTLVLHRVIEYNKLLSKDERILIIPIADINEKLRIDLVYHKEVPLVRYLNGFIDSISKILKKKYLEINKIIGKI
ncbi:LysR family transcriptional regulator [Fusobacterium sp. PH5-44]|uniref:LysR family transcriptional regulator n=1 Tax=unclassified Fusobacterium TaxID=2648384 RepID=UPI003D1C7F96